MFIVGIFGKLIASALFIALLMGLGYVYSSLEELGLDGFGIAIIAFMAVAGLLTFVSAWVNRNDPRLVDPGKDAKDG